MKRKLTLIAATVALGALLVTGATLAWFTSTDTATNVVTVGNVDIDIVEVSGDDNATVTENKGIVWNGVMTPGQVLSKEPKIVNTGSNTAWVRASVDVKYYKGEEEIKLPAGVAAPTINYNTGDAANQWTAEGNYYYYNTELTTTDSGKETTNLFTTVTIPSSWTNQGEASMADVTVEVLVHADAIQYDNNDGTKNSDGTPNTTVKYVIKAFENFKTN